VRSLLIKCSIRGLCYHSLLISCSVTLAAAVFKEGVVIASGVAGTRRAEQDIPVGIEDRFHIGSDTKAFTSLLAGKFGEEGKLRWDSTLAGVFPELKDTMDAEHFRNCCPIRAAWPRTGRSSSIFSIAPNCRMATWTKCVIEWSRKPHLNRSIMREAASLPIRISATPSPALSWNALAPKPGRLLVVLGLVCEPPIASR
jgi:Beta-lactamase